ncbi:MAG TPA: hypothetical protein PKC30_07955 [Saprospiraceae bacterium]|nr:hypothetical protein [Saprospiraceae bacterium]
MKKIFWSRGYSALTGGIIYMSGDTVAAWISNEVSIVRLLGIFLVGSSIYAWEIQSYFQWIEGKTSDQNIRFRALKKALMAMIYFNPIWISRHLLFVFLFSGKAYHISWYLLQSGLIAFIVNIPISVVANYLIQNVIILRYRFWVSAVFSGIMAIYYSMSSIWF